MHNKAGVAPWPSIEIPETFPVLESSDAIGQLLNALNSLNLLSALKAFHTKRDIGNGT